MLLLFPYFSIHVDVNVYQFPFGNLHLIPTFRLKLQTPHRTIVFGSRNRFLVDLIMYRNQVLRFCSHVFLQCSKFFSLIAGFTNNK